MATGSESPFSQVSPYPKSVSLQVSFLSANVAVCRVKLTSFSVYNLYRSKSTSIHIGSDGLPNIYRDQVVDSGGVGAVYAAGDD